MCYCFIHHYNYYISSVAVYALIIVQCTCTVYSVIYIENYLGDAILKKYMDDINGKADPIKLATLLHNRKLIADGTKQKAPQSIGIDTYRMNAEIMNEAEKVVKGDNSGSKFLALCEELAKMDLLKEIAAKMEEARQAGIVVSSPIQRKSKQHTACDTIIYNYYYVGQRTNGNLFILFVLIYMYPCV